MKSEVNTWFAAAMAASDPKLAVIVGEHYDGKTWLIFDWLKDKLATLPVLVFFMVLSQIFACRAFEASRPCQWGS